MFIRLCSGEGVNCVCLDDIDAARMSVEGPAEEQRWVRATAGRIPADPLSPQWMGLGERLESGAGVQAAELDTVKYYGYQSIAERWLEESGYEPELDAESA